VAAPASVADTHVHSMRVAGGTNAGAEVLVARVLLKDGTAGYGFTFNEDAGAARDMAAWDALCRSRGVPLHALLGGTYRKQVKVERNENSPALAPDWNALRKGMLNNEYDLLRIDPFAWGSVEQFSTIAAAANAFDLGLALFAPNAHPWELQFCAALAATVRGDDTRIFVRTGETKALPVKSGPGVGVDWSSEPGFDKLQWQS
jgi:L-alanine-DL-glutamate epimerase-like enolase superfamily enzyme